MGALHKSETDQDSTYSGDGSNTDSGKGPSEEGDNSHIQGKPDGYSSTKGAFTQLQIN